MLTRAAVVKALLNNLVDLGVDASVRRLFVIDNSNPMRSTSEHVG